MYRKIFLLFSILFLFFSNSYTQDIEKAGGYARFVALGFNPYIVDPEAIKVNPAWGTTYDNFLWGDIGGGTGAPGNGQFLGVNFGLSKNFTLGGLLARNDFTTNAISKLDPLNNLGLINQIVPLNNNLEIFAAFGVSSFTFGLGVAYAASSDETANFNQPTTTASASQLGINAGILANFTPSMMLDFGVSFIMPNSEFEAPAPNALKVSQSILGLQARFFMKVSSKFRLIPSAFFVNASGTREANSVETDLNSISSIGIGLGMEYTVGDFLLVGGPGFNTRTITSPAVANVSPELATTSMAFPVWNIGAEWNALDWLVARVGYFGSTSSTTTESQSGATNINERTTTSYVPYGYNLGLGFRFGTFALECVVNEQALRNGLANIGGTLPTFSYISMSYAF